MTEWRGEKGKNRKGTNKKKRMVTKKEAVSVLVDRGREELGKSQEVKKEK